MQTPELREQLLDAVLPHVPFDGWSEAAFLAAVTDLEADATLAREACPRGAMDLAIAYHKRGDALMLARLQAADLEGLKFREKVTLAVRLRLETVEDKELVRRGTALFALPQNAGDGMQLVWGTADAIWEALGDTSRDINWYTKRATLGGVYSATVLYWLGDSSEGHVDTWAFLDRRIEDVMRFEKLKSDVRANKFLSGLLAGPMALLGRVKAPDGSHKVGMPGRWNK